MFHIRSTALPAAVCLSIVVGACQDAPLAPKPPASAESVRGRNGPSERHIYSGAAADSVVKAVLTAWAANGHPEYLERHTALELAGELASRRAANARAATVAKLLVAGGAGSQDGSMQPPSILAHHENLYFGSPQIATTLEASMQFVGTWGSINSNVTITGKSSVYPAIGSLASGAGTPVNCADVLFSSCATRSLSGAWSKSDAPYCDATASGSIAYLAQNGDAAVGGIPLSGSGGSLGAPVTAYAYVTNSAGPCVTKPDTQPTYTPPGGGGTPDPDSPSWPTPTQPEPPGSDPSPMPGGLGDNWHCETVQWFSGGVLVFTQINCYNDN